MIAAIARKELRELLPLAVVAGLLQAYVLSTLMNVPLGFNVATTNSIAFVGNMEFMLCFIVAAGFAIGIGLWQTMWESSRGTFHFLLHRPVGRQQLFAAKLLTGAAACLVLSAAPTLLYALWAARPGNQAAPFEWSFTGWAWVMCLEMLPLYLAAFLCGLRPARWYGSRFLPLAAAITAIMFLQFLPWQLVVLTLTFCLMGLYLVAIFYVARERDYS